MVTVVGDHCSGEAEGLRPDAATEICRIQKAYRDYGVDHRTRWDGACPGNRAMLRERDELVTGMLVSAIESEGVGASELRVVDVGCGYGRALSRLQSLGFRAGRLFGVDLLADRIQAAKAVHCRLQFGVTNASSMGIASSTVDLVLLYTVFSSILDEGLAAEAAREVDRVLVDGRWIAWYDMRAPNPFNNQIRRISVRQLRGYFPGYRMYLKAVTVLPPLARRLGRCTDLLYHRLAAIPCLRTHWVGLLQKPSRCRG